MFPKRTFIFYMYTVPLVKMYVMGNNISHVHRPLWKDYLFHCNLASHTALSLMHGKSSLGWRRWKYSTVCAERRMTLIARFMGPTWDPSGADRTQMGPMLAPWTLLSGEIPRFHTGLSENHGPVIITCVIHSHTFCNIIVPSSTVDHHYMHHRNKAIPNVLMTYEILTVISLSSWVIRTKFSWIKRTIKQ